MIIKKIAHYERETLYPNTIRIIPDNVAERWSKHGIAKITEADIPEPETVVIDKSYPKYRVSIVILVHNALPYVKKCLDSLVKFTSNYELIIIDNGSNNETKKYLAERKEQLGFTLQTNKKNMGFSYGCNQGIKLATSDYICFLNSDTMVSKGWLDNLMEGFDMPDAGIVGASTCWSAGKQMIRKYAGSRKYATQSDVNKIAVSLPHKIIETDVYGFCYMVKREVIDRIGVFDADRYPVGSTEEKDFSWRAHKAGYKSYWVKHSYVHHFGGATFAELGINGHKQRVENEKAFIKRQTDKNIFIKNMAIINEPYIPILMIVLNRLDYTKQAIEALLKNTRYPFELFIFNNGSDTETTDYLNSLTDDRISIHHSKTNLGLVPPMNMFFDKYKSKYVAKVDNDTVVQAGWLGKLKKVMDTYPIFTVEANHYFAMPFKIKTNDDFYKHCFGVEFDGAMVYFYNTSGGTGQLIRRKLIDKPISEAPGTLSGWTSYQNAKWKSKGYPSAFYTGTWIDRLDQIDTNKYKSKSDYPDYDKMIKKLRPYGIGYYRMRATDLEKVKRQMERWYAGL